MLGEQLNEARRSMADVQKEIVAALSESLNAQAQAVLRDFQYSMEESARLSIERWRLTMANGLNALVKRLGEQFQMEAEAETNAAAD
jgi:hypothetical protein